MGLRLHGECDKCGKEKVIEIEPSYDGITRIEEDHFDFISVVIPEGKKSVWICYECHNEREKIKNGIHNEIKDIADSLILSRFWGQKKKVAE